MNRGARELIADGLLWVADRCVDLANWLNRKPPPRAPELKLEHPPSDAPPPGQMELRWS